MSRRYPPKAGLLDWLESPSATLGVYEFDGGAADPWTLHPYTKLAADTLGVAAALIDAGVGPADTVSLLSARPPEFISGFMGVLAAGATPAPAPTPLTFLDANRYAAHLRRMQQAAQSRVLLAGSPQLDTARAALAGMQGAPAVLDLTSTVANRSAAPAARTRDLAEIGLLQFTSGTTGVPKGVLVPADALSSNIYGITQWGGWDDETDGFASWLPSYHDMGLIGTVLLPMLIGGDLWSMTPLDFLRDPARWLECFEPGRATITAAPSFAFAYSARRVAAERWAELDLSSWRIAIIGAERVEPSTLRNFVEKAAVSGFDPRTFAPAYGLAENTLAATVASPLEIPVAVRLEAEVGAIGRPVHIGDRAPLDELLASGGAGWLVGCGRSVTGTDVWIADGDGARVDDGVLGEIHIAGTSLGCGYRRVNGLQPLDHEGHATGDAGFISDGELFVVGRIGVGLTIDGRNVFAEDLEARITTTLGFQAGRVVAALDSTTDGHVAVVACARPDGVSAGDVLTVVRAAVGKEVRVVIVQIESTAIPRTSSGKPRRHHVFAEWQAGALDDTTELDSEHPVAKQAEHASV